MSKLRLLPKMAVNSILRNKIVYFPYILTMALSIAVYYTFSCTIGNNMLDSAPYAGYLKMLLVIGRGLLAIILVPFLFYTNSFLIKKRKKELGLYTVLGLEKKHVAIMLIVETVLMLVAAMAIGLLTSIAFSRLIFLVLINASGMPKDAVYSADSGSLASTMHLFLIISALNLVTNLWQVTMINPTELLRGGQKGEKEPKHMVLTTILGVLILGGGYAISLTAQMDSWIFVSFFFAVLFVVVGSYFLFTSGSIAMLHSLKKRRNYYYHKNHFVTISGMLYRMKRNASSLSNICIFSTMIMITLICTLSLITSADDIMAFDSPYDGEYMFMEDETLGNAFQEKIEELADKNSVTITEIISYPYGAFSELEDGNVMGVDTEDGLQDNEMPVHVITLEEYNAIEGCDVTLAPDEILLYATAKDYAYTDVIREDRTYQIKEQLHSIRIDTKEPHTYSNRRYYLIVPTNEDLVRLCGTNIRHRILLNVEGSDAGKKAFLSEMDIYANGQSNYLYTQNIIDRTGMMTAMNGGLLFMGVFFGMIFTIFLVLIMYYKQIAEGLEDCDSFHIMQNVGMSKDDVKGTIKNQILLVFGLPLVAAILHTSIGLVLTMKLLYALNIYNVANILISSAIVMIVFIIFYGVSYLMTAKTYYKLVVK